MKINMSQVWIGAILLFVGITGTTTAWAAKCDLKKDISTEMGRAGMCKFDRINKRFEGTPAQQAGCLTREVLRKGEIGKETITPFFQALVGRPAPPVQAVQALLDAQGIKSANLGGALGKSVSANYFIIHDTSTPNCSANGPSKSCPTKGEFPANRDDPSWNFNQSFGGHPKAFPDRLAHAFTNRVGASITEVDFADHIVTTKFESCADLAAKLNLFIGVENIQPRLGDPAITPPGKKVNDREAPNPGFTEKQYERLALLYLVASARRGQWLIPAYHAVLDQFYADGHDDPQHFDMAAFSAQVQKLSDAIPAASPPLAVGVQPQSDDYLSKRD